MRVKKKTGDLFPLESLIAIKHDFTLGSERGEKGNFSRKKKR